MRRHAQIAFRTAYLITGSAADAEEAAQDGFVKAHRALGRFRPAAPFRPWLLQIVANEARNRRRAAGRRAALVLRAGRESPSGGAAPPPERALLAAEERSTLLAALDSLDERDRLVIGCRYLLELSEAETAAALGCRPGHGQVAALARARAPARRGGGGASRCLTSSSNGWRSSPPRWSSRPRRTCGRAVSGRMTAPARRRLIVPARRSLAIAALVLLLLAAVAGAVPAVRDAVGDLLGLGGATVERVPELPPSPGAVDLGRRVDAACRRCVPHDSRLGAPDGSYVRGRGQAAQATVLYRPAPGLPAIAGTRIGLLLTQFRGDLDPDLVQKFIGPGTGTRRVRVGAAPGFWIDGPHAFGYRDADGARADRGPPARRPHAALAGGPAAAPAGVGAAPTSGAGDRARRWIDRRPQLGADDRAGRDHRREEVDQLARAVEPSGAPWPRKTATGTSPSSTTDQCLTRAPHATVASSRTR